MNPDSSAGIYVTVSVEAECKFIAQNQKMKEGGKIKMIKLNSLKRSVCMNKHVKMFVKLVEATANLPNYLMASEDPSTPLLQILLSLSTGIIK